MCGIFGIIVRKQSSVNERFIQTSLESIARYSVARGKDSSGIVFKDDGNKTCNLVKGDIPIHSLLKSLPYKEAINQATSSFKAGNTFQAIGHARLVTNGSQLEAHNNQPVVKNGIIGIHNGIVVNADNLWAMHPHLERAYEIDTEILFSLIANALETDMDMPQAIRTAMDKVTGTVSAAMMFQDRNEMILITNNGSLYYILTDDYLIFASEAFFLHSLVKKLRIQAEVKHLKAFSGLIIDTETFSVFPFPLASGSFIASEKHGYYELKTTNLKGNWEKDAIIDPSVFINRSQEKHLFDLLENNEASIRSLKRCSRCILPETFPFIAFDSLGICNYCHNHQHKPQVNSLDKLRELVEPYRKKDGSPDCIVPFSGGRDSTYSLHIVKEELGLNPIAFTYDWGMVTDLARRNIARACGKLGVENIVVSADINWKRENIRKNITAWLKRPDLGMIPLFMAGDKFFFYYCNQVRKQTGIDLNIWGINDLENTNFKTGFAGIEPAFNKKRIYSLSIRNQIKLFGFVGKNFISSPGYLNQSILDSLGSFAVRYLAPKKDYFHLFDYYKWDEQELEDLIRHEYQWETAIDTNSTWRVGDGTAAFYNYIYLTVAGFTENDTFRSNQIRESLLSRETALEKVYEENIVRYETLRWYLEIIGLDYNEVITRVNAIPKLYAVMN